MNQSQFRMSVIPAKAGTHQCVSSKPTIEFGLCEVWIHLPAFAGMTMLGEQRNAA
jgi:hypothetical protein